MYTSVLLGTRTVTVTEVVSVTTVVSSHCAELKLATASTSTGRFGPDSPTAEGVRAGNACICVHTCSLPVCVQDGCGCGCLYMHTYMRCKANTSPYIYTSF